MTARRSLNGSGPPSPRPAWTSSSSSPFHAGRTSHTPHDFIAERVAEYPGRAVGFASVDPNDPGAADEFERAVTTHGLRGLKISPTYQSIDPRSAACWRLYEIAEAHRTP